MYSFWLKFEDGSEACCQGYDAFDAVLIAEKVSGKTVAVPKELRWRPEQSDAVSTLPYPAYPCIWRYTHPVYGATPLFCTSPTKCKGSSSCPRSYSCPE